MKKLYFISVFVSFFVFTFSVRANIGVSSMMIFSNSEGQAEIRISNTANHRQFVQSYVSALSVKDGELIPELYTRKNIEDWQLSVFPSKMILNVGQTKPLKFSFKMKNKEDRKKDHAFQIQLIPKPYLDKGEKIDMKMSIGLAPYLIVPAVEDGDMNIDMTYSKGNLTVLNSGETYVRAYIDACPDDLSKPKKGCSKTVFSLSGRKISVDLSDFVKSESIKVKLSTHNKKFNNEFKLSDGESKKIS